jgi:hypothetical protein
MEREIEADILRIVRMTVPWIGRWKLTSSI